MASSNYISLACVKTHVELVWWYQLKDADIHFHDIWLINNIVHDYIGLDGHAEIIIVQYRLTWMIKGLVNKFGSTLVITD